MTSKHQSPEWRRTCRVIRQQVRAAWARGDDVNCWRHGDPLPEGTPYDVGHLDPYGGESLANAAPECRRGNRSHGGKLGARITNARRQAGTKPTASSTTTEMITPPWM